MKLLWNFLKLIYKYRLWFAVPHDSLCPHFPYPNCFLTENWHRKISEVQVLLWILFKRFMKYSVRFLKSSGKVQELNMSKLVGIMLTILWSNTFKHHLLFHWELNVGHTGVFENSNLTYVYFFQGIHLRGWRWCSSIRIETSSDCLHRRHLLTTQTVQLSSRRGYDYSKCRCASRIWPF